MFCPKCGKEIESRSKFCKYCGATIAKTNRAERIRDRAQDAADAIGAAVQKPGRKRAPWIGLGALAVLVLVIVVLAGAGKGKGAKTEQDTGKIGTETAQDAAGNGGAKSDSAKPEEEATAGKSRKWSKEYEKAYQATWDGMQGIIASYWEGGDQLDRAIAGLSGSAETFYQGMKQLDPEFFDYASADIAGKTTDSALGYHMVDESLRNGLFADNELGRELRAAGEAVFLDIVNGLMHSSLSSYKDSDVMVGIHFNGEYALVLSRGSIGDVLKKMDADSGYSLVGPALKDYRDKLDPQMTKNGLDAFNAVANNDKELSEKVDEMGARLRGIGDALDDYEQQWEEDREAWRAKFFASLGLEGEEAAEAASYRIFCIIDKDEKVYACFPCRSTSCWIGSDGTAYQFMEDSMSRWNGSSWETPFAGEDFYHELHFTGSHPFLRLRAENNFDYGDYFILESVTEDGSTKELLRGKGSAPSAMYDHYHPSGMIDDLYCYDGSGIWLVEYKALGDGTNQSVIIELDTGTVTARQDWLAAHPGAGPVDESRYSDSHFTRLNDRYIYYSDTQSIYACPDAEGKTGSNRKIDPAAAAALVETLEPVITLDAGGGTKRIFYGNGEYWVQTANNYYYVLDGNFKRIAEPVLIPNDFGAWAYTSYGALIMADGKTGLYDEQGDLLFQFSADYYCGFIAGTRGSYPNPFHDPYGNYDFSYNLNTHQRMYLKLGDG